MEDIFTRIGARVLSAMHAADHVQVHEQKNREQVDVYDPLPVVQLSKTPPAFRPAGGVLAARSPLAVEKPKDEPKVIEEGKRDGVHYKLIEFPEQIIYGTLIEKITKLSKSSGKKKISICIYLDRSGSMYDYKTMIFSQFARIFRILGDDAGMDVSVMLASYEGDTVKVLLPLTRMNERGQAKLVKAALGGFKIEGNWEKGDVAINHGRRVLRKLKNRSMPFIVLLSDKEAEDEDISSGRQRAKEEAIRNAADDGIETLVIHDTLREFAFDEEGKVESWLGMLNDTSSILQKFVDTYGKRGKNALENLAGETKSFILRLAIKKVLNPGMEMEDMIAELYGPISFSDLIEASEDRDIDARSCLVGLAILKELGMDIKGKFFGKLILTGNVVDGEYHLFHMFVDKAVAGVTPGERPKVEFILNGIQNEMDEFEKQYGPKATSYLEDLSRTGKILLMRLAAMRKFNPDLDIPAEIMKWHSFSHLDATSSEDVPFHNIYACSLTGLALLAETGGTEAGNLIGKVISEKLERGARVDPDVFKALGMDMNSALKSLTAFYSTLKINELETIVRYGKTFIQRYAALALLHPERDVVELVKSLYFDSEDKLIIIDWNSRNGNDCMAIDECDLSAPWTGLMILKENGTKEAKSTLLNIAIHAHEKTLIGLDFLRGWNLEPETVWNVLMSWYDDPCFATEGAIKQIVDTDSPEMIDTIIDGIASKFDEKYLNGIHLYAVFSYIPQVRTSATLRDKIDRREDELSISLDKCKSGWYEMLPALVKSGAIREEDALALLDSIRKSYKNVDVKTFTALISLLPDRDVIGIIADCEIGKYNVDITQIRKWVSGLPGRKRNYIYRNLLSMGINSRELMFAFYETDPQEYHDCAAKIIVDKDYSLKMRQELFFVVLSDVNSSIGAHNLGISKKRSVGWDDSFEFFSDILRKKSSGSEIRQYIIRLLPKMKKWVDRNDIIDVLKDIADDKSDPLNEYAVSALSRMRK